MGDIMPQDGRLAVEVAVTTSTHPNPSTVQRARQVAARCGVPFVERRGSIARLRANHGVAWVYVVARDREIVTDGTTALQVDPGLLHAKRAAGTAHPLIRALSGSSGVARVFDGTLGMAGDAAHIAAVLGCEVVASEASAIVFSLTEFALRSGVFGEAGHRIRPVLGAASDVLGAAGTFDAVFLAPMFESPARAAPGYPVFRALADHRVLDASTLERARRAAPRVVVRVEKHQGPPEPKGWRAVPGKAVDYWVYDSRDGRV
jgi:hypothetical protein